MSWRKRLGQLVAEFGEDVVQQASRVLASDATEAQARKTLERVMRTVPEGVDFAAKSPAATAKRAKPLTVSKKVSGPPREPNSPAIPDRLIQEGYVADKAARQANLDRFQPYRGGGEDPMVFYHATPADFTVFKPGGDDPSRSGSAIWLSPYAEHQPAFHRISGPRGSRFKEGTNVKPLYASMRSPLVLDDANMLEWAQDVFAGGNREFPYLMPQDVVDTLRSEGYDSVAYTPPVKTYPNGETDMRHEYIVFEPTQLKSATGNRGTYDPNDPDIRKARGGLAVKRKKGKR